MSPFITDVVKARAWGNTDPVTFSTLLCGARGARRSEVMKPFITEVMNLLVRGYSRHSLVSSLTGLSPFRTEISIFFW